MPNPMRTPTCPYCQRRRVIEIHRTAGGGVARIGQRPCECPKFRKINDARLANRYLAKLALIPAALTGFYFWVVGLEAGIFSGATIAIGSIIVYLMNRPRR